MGPRLRGDDTELAAPQKRDLSVVIASPLDSLELRRRCECGIGRLLHHDQRAWCEPAAGVRRGERLLGQALAIGRIEEHERERLDRMRRTKPGGIAAEDARDAAEPERRD